MITRRAFLGTSLTAGATLALTPELLRALQQPGAAFGFQLDAGGTVTGLILQQGQLKNAASRIR